MKKSIPIILLICFVTYFMPFKTFAYSGGAFDGRVMALGDSTFAGWSSTNLVTDNDRATGIVLSATTPHQTTVFNSFPSPVNIRSYKIYKLGNAVKLIYKINGSSTVFSIDNGPDDGEVTVNLTGVTMIGIFCPNSGGATIREFDVFLNDSTPPANPTNLTVTNNTLTSMDLNFTTPSDADFDKYKIYRNNSLVFSSNSGTAKNSPFVYSATGLSPATDYTWKVTAVDVLGNESAGAVITGTTLAPDTTPPAKPTGLSAVGGDQKISLSWTPNTESDLAGYFIYDQDGQRINGTPLTSTSYEVTGLSINTNYSYSITAIDQGGNESARSDPATAKTDEGPDAPVLKASSEDTKVSLSWSAVPGATEYVLYRNGSELARVQGTSYVDTQVQNDNVYTYEVAAVITGTQGRHSAQVKAKPGKHLSFEPGGAVSGTGTDVMDTVKTGWSFANKYGPYIVIVLGIIFAPVAVSFITWIMGKTKPEPSQTQNAALLNERGNRTTSNSIRATRQGREPRGGR